MPTPGGGLRQPWCGSAVTGAAGRGSRVLCRQGPAGGAAGGDQGRRGPGRLRSGAGGGGGRAESDGAGAVAGWRSPAAGWFFAGTGGFGGVLRWSPSKRRGCARPARGAGGGPTGGVNRVVFQFRFLHAPGSPGGLYIYGGFSSFFPGGREAGNPMRCCGRVTPARFVGPGRKERLQRAQHQRTPHPEKLLPTHPMMMDHPSRSLPVPVLHPGTPTRTPTPTHGPHHHVLLPHQGHRRHAQPVLPRHVPEHPHHDHAAEPQDRVETACPL